MSIRFPLVIAAALLSLAPAAVAQSVVSFTATTFSSSEAGPGVVILTHTGNLDAPVSFSVQIKNLVTNATFNSFSSFSKGFPNRSISVNFGSDPLQDKYYNPGRKYLVTLLSVTGGTIGTPSSAQLDIIDDELPPQLTVNDVFMDEGHPGPPVKRVIFVVRMTTPMPVGITVPYSLHNGYAKAGIDYQHPFPQTIFFARDQTFFELPVNIIPDNSPEGDETFSIELGTPPPGSGITVAKSTGTCRIIDDDGAVTPLSQRVARGGKGIIRIRLTEPAFAPESVTLDNADPFLTVPSSVEIPAGASSVDVEFGTSSIGQGTIYVTLPPGRARTYGCSVTVYDPLAITLDPLVVSLPLGATANVTAKLDPPPATPIALGVTQTNSSITEIPTSVAVDAKGSATIPVRGAVVGFTSVILKLPELMGDVNGGAATVGFVVVVNAPTGLAITSLSQKSGRTSGGEMVKVFGSNLAGRCVVSFGGVPSPSSELPANGAINAATPPHDAGVVDVGIRCGKDTFVSPNAFTYSAAPLSVTGLSPASGGTRGGTIVVIRGTNLRTGGCSARFGGLAAHAIAWGGTTSLTVTAPAHAAGTVPVTLTCGSDSATAAGGFNYLDAEDAPATIATASPLRAAPGDRVTLSGSRFRLDDAISFGAAAASDEVPPSGSDTRLVVVPELPPGMMALSLRDAAGRTAAGPKIEITAPAAVTVTQIAARLAAGAELAMAGTGFRRALTFTLGPAILQALSITSTRAVFRAPSSLAAGPTSFTISDHGTPLVSRPLDVTTTELGVTAMSPPCSVREGGVLATISGSGFENGAMVQFGTTYSADVAFSNRFTLMAKVPPAFGGNDAAITVINPDGSTATLTNAFTYKSAAEGGCTPRRRAAGH